MHIKAQVEAPKHISELSVCVSIVLDYSSGSIGASITDRRNYVLVAYQVLRKAVFSGMNASQSSI